MYADLLAYWGVHPIELFQLPRVAELLTILSFVPPLKMTI